MNRIRPNPKALSSCLLYRQVVCVQQRTYATEPPTQRPSFPPNPNLQQSASATSKPPSRVRAFYKTFSYPILKCFLGALFTYQLAYYVWLKLEVVEEQAMKENEIQGLKNDLKGVVLAQKEGVRSKVQEVEPRAETVKEVKKSGWRPW